MLFLLRPPLLVLLLCACCVPLVTQAQNEPDSSTRLARLAAQHWQAFLADNAVAATLFIGRHDFESRFTPDIRPTARRERQHQLQIFLSELDRIDQTSLPPHEQLTARLLRAQLRAEFESHQFPHWLMPFNHYANPLLLFIQQAATASPQNLPTRESVQAFADRATAAATWIDQAIANLREGLKQGVSLPRPLALRAQQSLAPLLTTEPPLKLFAGVVRAAEAHGGPELARPLEALLREVLAPAFARLSHFLNDEYLPAARTTAGYAALPNGPAWYQERVRFHTTTDLTPDEIHAHGLRLVAHTLEQMEAVKLAVDFEGTLAEFYQYLAAHPDLTPGSAEALLDAHRAVAARVAPKAAELFVRQPKAPLEIREVEAFRQAGAPGALYFPPTASDGSRPGIFYLNTRNLPEHPLHEVEALFLHEAIPGHHFQISLAAELADTPEFQRRLFVTSFIEGWGLYAESLGRELGLYQDPLTWFGRLRYDLFRSARLVVDTGLHAKGWSREQAIAYLRDLLPMTDSAIASEVDRYLADPGQALAYKIGELEIRRLRSLAETRLGAAFDIGAFHDAVLRQGALPLQLLEDVVQMWIQRQTRPDNSPRANPQPTARPIRPTELAPARPADHDC